MWEGASRIRIFLIRMACCVSYEGTASHSANQLVGPTILLSIVLYNAVRQQTKLVDRPLVIADRRHAIFCHIVGLPGVIPAHTVLQHVINVTKGGHLAVG